MRRLCGAGEARLEKQRVSGAAHEVAYPSVRGCSAAGGNKGGEANGAVTGGAAGQKRGAPFVPLTMESRGKAPRMSASQAGRAARPGAPPFRPPQLQGRCGNGARLLAQVRKGLRRVRMRVEVCVLQHRACLRESNSRHCGIDKREYLPYMSYCGSHAAYAGAVALLQPAYGVHAAAMKTVVEEACCKEHELLAGLQCAQVLG